MKLLSNFFFFFFRGGGGGGDQKAKLSLAKWVKLLWTKQFKMQDNAIFVYYVFGS